MGENKDWKKPSNQDLKREREEKAYWNIHVTRGELRSVVASISESVNKLEQVISGTNLGVTAIKDILIEKGLLTEDDLQTAIKAIVEKHAQEIEEKSVINLEAKQEEVTQDDEKTD